jgi:hypothetical protein|tara:strand:- start:20 stop:322 length:303 start_codon:yes stop_codon:yes gene_type:complete
MNIGPEEFLNMLPKYFWRKMDGFYKLINLKERQDWERCRWQTTLLLNVHTDKGKTIKPQDLIKFEWETDIEKHKVDYEKLKSKAEYIKKLEDTKLRNNGK